MGGARYYGAMTPRLTISRLVVLFTMWGMGSACFRRVPPEPVPQPAQAEDYALTFLNFGHTYCDAQMLAWSNGLPDPYAAKVSFGRQLSEGRKIYGDIDKAHAEAKSVGAMPCDYYSSEFGYNDAHLLAGYWGVGVDEAKLRIGKLLSWQGSWSVYQELKWAQEGDFYREGQMDPQMAAVEAFWDSEQVTTCDAELLAAHWGVDFYDAKIALGEKVLGGWSRPDIEASSLSAAREHGRRTGASCSYWGSDLSLDQVEELACFFGIGVSDAKAKVGRYAFEGRVGELRALLPQAATCTQ